MRVRILQTVTAALFVAAIAASCSTDPQGAREVPTSPSNARGAAKVKSVTVSPATASLVVGGSVQLTATVVPGGSGALVTWESNNASVATVTGDGVVTAVATGSATITASAGGQSGSSAITVNGAPPEGSVVMVGAGDIAACAVPGDEAVADLLDTIDGTVFTLGDNVYDSGTLAEYNNCYGPSWGRHKARTRPTPGNHEYYTANASGYFSYFGAAAGEQGKGYYSYDLGDWHVVVLNSNSSCTDISCAAGSPQEKWLRADLAANTKSCTIAYWHHPRFNSGLEHGNNTSVAPLWNALYEFNADVIMNGHEHLYERFAPQDPSARADAARGIRQFVVGTGGRSHYGIGTIKANSEVRNTNTYGVLKLTLSAGAYAWQFVPVAGATFTDSGTGTCH